MASQRTKLTVGLFITSGIGIALLAFIWLGMSGLLRKGQEYVTYFDESVQGLKKDSFVKYRGVSVGRVKSIGIAPDSKLIEVVLKIESGQKLDENIVAQLKMAGFMGSVFIGLDRKDPKERDRSPKLNFHPKLKKVASKPSDISELWRGAAVLLEQIEYLNLKGISDNIIKTLDSINQMVADANVKGISEDIKLSLESVNHILDQNRWDNIMASVEKASQSLNNIMDKTDRSLDRVENTLTQVEGIVTEKENDIKTAIEDFRLAMKNVNTFLEKGTTLVSNTDDSLSHLRVHLLVIAKNLKKGSENLNRLIELLSDQPSQLIFGEPPTPRKLEQ